MPRFAANLSTLYPQHDFLDRFAAAAADGFSAIEFLFPYEYAAAQIRQRLDDHGLEQAMFNMPPGDFTKGERGIASLPGRESEFRSGFQKALEYAAVLGNDRIHAMAGLLPREDLRERHHAVYLENLRYATQEAAKVGITVLIEPINTRDIPGFFLNRQDQAHEVRKAVGADNLLVQLDCYHCQIVEGDVTSTLRRDFAGIGHIQIAGVPDRHEPDIGELNYPWLFEELDRLGYTGWVGCEYRPKGDTSAGLQWLRDWQAKNPV
ncbi:2-oxo-tetronate isomerase [Xanthomonas sp. WHRI 1810A]|uniref:2-oxo-tetronate isomerase n=1 Tax=Xanthomonas sp. WHRI 1810A TaxID=3161565 RepID=UPI0032E8A9E9